MAVKRQQVAAEPEAERWWTLPELERTFRVSTRTTNREIEAGRLTAIDIGTGTQHNYRVPDSAWVEWTNSRKMRVTA